MKNKELEVPKEKQAPAIPGIGVSGAVFCPFGFQKGLCVKNGCEMWLELFYKDEPVGRCSFPWGVKVIVDIRESIDKLSAKLDTLLPAPKKAVDDAGEG